MLNCRQRVLRTLGLLALGFCAACSSSEKERKYVALEVGTLYNIGADRLKEQRFREGAIFFDEVERQHPYSQWARRAQLMSAYSHYQAKQYDESILSAERFLSLHPGNQHASYAYYLIAMNYFEQISDIERDQRITRQAYAALLEIVRRFPESDYAKDARIKLDWVLDHLAAKEMDIGRFYLNRGQHLAAIGRFRTVVKVYQTSTHVPEALHRLTEAYLSIGVIAEAKKTAAVLGHNFPESRWYEYSYNLLRRKTGLG
ncbi:MAG: outer membrane protein assembly factor BamD [Pseudomonadota bacterium]